MGQHAEAVVREGVSNAIRHADASDVVVTIQARDEFTIDIEDDGRGLPDQVNRSGLLNLEKRAEECHGTFEVMTRPGGGTHLRWSVPLGS